MGNKWAKEKTNEYVSPKMEILAFAFEDVITASLPIGTESQDVTTDAIDFTFGDEEE